MKKLICNEVARCQHVSLQKKGLLHILHHVSWLYFLIIYLQKRLWKCASTISSRKYNRQVALLVICSIMIPLSQLSSCWIWHLTFSWAQFLSNKLEFFVSYSSFHLLTIQSYKNILVFALRFHMCFFVKTWLFSITVIIIFCSTLTSVSNSHFQQ